MGFKPKPVRKCGQKMSNAPKVKLFGANDSTTDNSLNAKGTFSNGGRTWTNADANSGWDAVRLRVLTNATTWVKNNFNVNVLYGTFEHNGMSPNQPAYCRLTIVDKKDCLKTEEVTLLVDGVSKFTFVSREPKNSDVVHKEMNRQIIRMMKG